MSSKNRKGVANKKPFKKDRHVAKILSGILCIAVGLCMNRDIAVSADIPEWANMGPVIDVYAEELRANIDIDCSVTGNGNFVFTLSAGKWLNEPVRVWVHVQDLYYPFRWEIGDSTVDNVILVHTDSGEGITDDYPIERTFISQKTNHMSGTSKKYLSDPLYIEWFTAVIAPGKEECKITFQMEPEHAEYRTSGDIIIRMPYIINARDIPLSKKNISYSDVISGSENYNILSYFSNYMVDKAILFETDLDIYGRYFSKYMYYSNYLLTSIEPNPTQLFPSCSWTESMQWIPYIVFRDLNYDKRHFILVWFSGILIAVGSGLLVLPLPAWIQSAEKSKE